MLGILNLDPVASSGPTHPLTSCRGRPRSEGPSPADWQPFCAHTALLFVASSRGVSKLHELSTLRYEVRFVWNGSAQDSRAPVRWAQLRYNVWELRCITRTFSWGCFQLPVGLSGRNSLLSQGRSVLTQMIDLWWDPCFGNYKWHFPCDSLSFTFSCLLYMYTSDTVTITFVTKELKGFVFCFLFWVLFLSGTSGNRHHVPKQIRVSMF